MISLVCNQFSFNSLSNHLFHLVLLPFVSFPRSPADNLYVRVLSVSVAPTNRSFTFLHPVPPIRSGLHCEHMRNSPPSEIVKILGGKVRESTSAQYCGAYFQHMSEMAHHALTANNSMV